MKIFFVLIAFMLQQQWEPDFENAKKIAREKHELILLNFSGSDWCGPCIQLRKNYFESDVFRQMAHEHLVLVNADFPRKKKNQNSSEAIKRNEALAEIYNKNGIFPLTLLLDADGKVVKRWEGRPDISVEKWVTEIQSICNDHR